jgi:hypothetical protein
VLRKKCLEVGNQTFSLQAPHLRESDGPRRFYTVQASLQGNPHILVLGPIGFEDMIELFLIVLFKIWSLFADKPERYNSELNVDLLLLVVNHPLQNHVGELL